MLSNRGLSLTMWVSDIFFAINSIWKWLHRSYTSWIRFNYQLIPGGTGVYQASVLILRLLFRVFAVRCPPLIPLLVAPLIVPGGTVPLIQPRVFHFSPSLCRLAARLLPLCCLKHLLSVTKFRGKHVLYFLSAKMQSVSEYINMLRSPR